MVNRRRQSPARSAIALAGALAASTPALAQVNTTETPAGERARQILENAGIDTTDNTEAQDQTPPADADRATPSAPSGITFRVAGIDLAYATPHPRHPSIRDILDATRVRLVRVDGVLYAPDAAPEPTRGRAERITARLDELGRRELATLDATAVAAISTAVVRTFDDFGIGAVEVGPDPREVGQSGEDLRTGKRGRLALIIRTGRVTSLRTIAAGDRLDDGKSPVNRSEHREYLRLSPVQPAERFGPELRDPEQPELGQQGRRDLLRTDELDEFLARINRRPGRYARAIVGPDPQGDLALDLLITEAKPWIVFAQLSDTGSAATGDVRYRFGFRNDQLTGNDDSLALTYITSAIETDPNFEAVSGSYEARVGTSDRLRWRVSAAWSDFTAAELGRDEDAFTGQTTEAAAALIANVAQRGELFLDLEAGARFQHIEVTNNPAVIDGDEDLLILFGGAVLEKRTITDDLRASFRLEGADGDWTTATQPGLTTLGRTGVSDAWLIFTYDTNYSFYLEPIINPAGWKDPTTPGSSTLAHEIALTLRGQWALDHRLIPQQQGVVGGLYSVRGYPESIAAGDSTIAASAEYRFHVPRAFGVNPDPASTPLFGRPFRFAPSQVYGAPDWDLVLKAFADGARVWQSDVRAFEDDESLLGLGVGAELAIRNNIRLRAEYAIAAEPVRQNEREGVSRGDGEFHFAITLSY